ncbi:PIN domain family protein [Thioalkalivibrio nitratireducens DSM 14787]|uniref:Ribonuclease VapC n=1 Tax=Thioalkalivibrio nitratireducens (strain DSM 14787 / UNIQEM 213 / ALEN2) TaxID=1255043 RepID=L0DS91_THIND|nr:TA system VapC family ribonuclease toxin [Thioalkalivibrio nitratireducens]AGA32464.1 PIN domain family protein [Thioalkalivibrio nitratireducens DSM 14787]
MRALLDINVVIALLDAAHTLHRSATNWLAQEIQHGWASCPITENGVVRIMSQPTYPNTQPLQQVALRVREAQQNSDHRFWPDDISLTASDLLNWPQLLGHRQITDAYLLAIAARNNGRLVTFDQRIRYDAVKGAEQRHLHVIRT